MAALPLRSARSPVWICSPASSLCQCHCGHSWGMLQGYNWFHLAVLQLKGQLGPTIPDLSDTLFLCSYTLRSCFCLPDRRNIIPLFFCCPCYLSTSQIFGSRSVQRKSALEHGKQQDKRSRGKEDNKTIIFGGIQPLLLTILLSQKRCV